MSKRNLAAAVFLSIVAVIFIFSALLMHPFGVLDNSDMDDYIIENAQTQTGADNSVTSVVFDYRGFDTLGEATVLFAAATGVVMIFRRLKK
jgi:multisubunit Na+/H+ antiporter MnhB subunit